MLNSEPFEITHKTGNSLEDTNPEAFSAFTAKSSPRSPAVFLAATLHNSSPSSIKLAMSSSNAKNPEAIKVLVHLFTLIQNRFLHKNFLEHSYEKNANQAYNQAQQKFDNPTWNKTYIIINIWNLVCKYTA